MSLERRASYRIVYPMEARPVFVVDGRKLVVADVSELGVRFGVSAQDSIQVGDDVEGTVHFRCGAEARARGTVLRIANGWAAVRLDARLPFAAILAEQRHLRARYPMWSVEL